MSEANLTVSPSPESIRFRESWAVALRLIAAFLAAALATTIFYKPPGSAVAVVYDLPFGILALEQIQKGWTRNSVPVFVLAALAIFAILLEPSALNMAAGFCFVSAAALTKRGALASDSLRMARYVLLGALAAPLRFMNDCWSASSEIRRLRPAVRFGNFAVPLAATILFGVLLIAANPVLESAVLSLDGLIYRWLGNPLANLFSAQVLIVFPLALVLSWSVLRSQAAVDVHHATLAPATWHEVFFKPTVITATLAILNFMFLTENALDIHHIWLRAALPAGMTHADYVHRGSYMLIVTVILAAAFIMVALRPGTETNASGRVRGLVYAFAAQNFLLVLSSAQRTLSYIDAYGLTEWRLAGLIWMGLVATGIGLTVWRIVAERDNRWLINANLSAAALVVLTCGLADFRPFIANFNVDRAIARLDPLAFDVSYNGRSLGFAALPALKRYQDHFRASAPFSPFVQAKMDEVMTIQRELQASFVETQGDWRSWTLRYAGWMIPPI